MEAKDKNVLIDFVGVKVIGPKTYTYGLKREFTPWLHFQIQHFEGQNMQSAWELKGSYPMRHQHVGI